MRLYVAIKIWFEESNSVSIIHTDTVPNECREACREDFEAVVNGTSREDDKLVFEEFMTGTLLKGQVGGWHARDDDLRVEYFVLPADAENSAND